MRRFWLLLLVFVLPLQMSWAAVHFCDDDLRVAAAFTAEPASHDHDVDNEAKKAEAQQAEKMADACCTAAHGCHGLHYLMAQADLQFPAGPSAAVPSSSGAAPPLGELLSRVERPKWRAA